MTIGTCPKQRFYHPNWPNTFNLHTSLHILSISQSPTSISTSSFNRHQHLQSSNLQTYPKVHTSISSTCLPIINLTSTSKPRRCTRKISRKLPHPAMFAISWVNSKFSPTRMKCGGASVEWVRYLTIITSLFNTFPAPHIRKERPETNDAYRLLVGAIWLVLSTNKCVACGMLFWVDWVRG